MQENISCIRSSQPTAKMYPTVFDKTPCYLNQAAEDVYTLPDESRFNLENDVGRVLIYREKDSKYYQSYVTERKKL